MFDTGFEEFGGWKNARKGFRAGRGMMEPAILVALSNRPMHGYEIISHLEEKSQGFWRPSPGSVYPTLQLLEEKDLVRSVERDGKKTYELTENGKAEVADGKEKLHTVFNQFFREEGRRMNMNHDYQRQFHKEAGEIVKTVRLIFRKGTSVQKAALDEAIKEFKIRVERIWEGEL